MQKGDTESPNEYPKECDIKPPEPYQLEQIVEENCEEEPILHENLLSVNEDLPTY